ncbi:hypothetical protein C0Q70_21222 [Pomacea canaliculata]|uniref:Uncharacterized protein n=1 Tax=Pomacea canaliculata TaxID=400727 RepID=A0A2T7NBZ5_POMCA|nr:hypothetical protein C0Q70_21222 [Pomacea canaliculata]
MSCGCRQKFDGADGAAGKRGHPSNPGLPYLLHSALQAEVCSHSLLLVSQDYRGITEDYSDYSATDSRLDCDVTLRRVVPPPPVFSHLLKDSNAAHHELYPPWHPSTWQVVLHSDSQQPAMVATGKTSHTSLVSLW